MLPLRLPSDADSADGLSAAAEGRVRGVTEDEGLRSAALRSAVLLWLWLLLVLRRCSLSSSDMYDTVSAEAGAGGLPVTLASAIAKGMGVKGLW